jgi:hypothetical protein
LPRIPSKAVALALLLGAVSGAVVLALLWDATPGEGNRAPAQARSPKALGAPPPLPVSAMGAPERGVQTGSRQVERAAAAAQPKAAAHTAEAAPSPGARREAAEAGGPTGAPGGETGAHGNDPPPERRDQALPEQAPSSPVRRLATAARAQLDAPGKGARSDEKKSAWLDIQVRPTDRRWQVWVDGQYCGTADVKVKVAPGRRLVEVGAERPTIKRPVRVDPRRTRRVLIQL